MNKRLAFIDHSYHKKTKSTIFLTKLLIKHFEVDVYWDYSWNNGPQVDLEKISKKRYDIVIFFQIIYPDKLTSKLNCDNIIYIPVYDSYVYTRRIVHGKFFRKLKFINFSKTLHLRFKKIGLYTKYFQYFHSTDEFLLQDNHFNELKGFFWQRTNIITWKHIRKTIKDTPFEKLHIHKAIDPPGHDFLAPSEEEIRKYNITISEWFPNREDFLKVLRASNVFFASRLYEGIGMSFIEAMTIGQCVVAPNTTTMNEYIRDGETGLLYDPRKPVPLDFSNAEQIAQNAREYCKNGYEKWVQSEGELIDFVTSNTSFNTKYFENKSIKSLVSIIFSEFVETLKHRIILIRHKLSNWLS